MAMEKAEGLTKRVFRIERVLRTRDDCVEDNRPDHRIWDAFDALEDAKDIIKEMREHLQANHDLAVASLSGVGVRHDEQSCDTCKVLKGQTKRNSEEGGGG